MIYTSCMIYALRMIYLLHKYVGSCRLFRFALYKNSIIGALATLNIFRKENISFIISKIYHIRIKRIYHSPSGVNHNLRFLCLIHQPSVFREYPVFYALQCRKLLKSESFIHYDVENYCKTGSFMHCNVENYKTCKL